MVAAVDKTYRDVEVEQTFLPDTKEVAVKKVPRRASSFIFFLLVGTVQLLGWNSLLNTSSSLYSVVFGIPEPPQTITAVYATVNCIGTALAFLFPVVVVRPSVTYFGVVACGMTALLYAITSHVDSNTAYYIMHIVGACMGFATLCIGCSAFGYSNFFPENYAGAISSGYGLAGVLSFAIWMVSQYVIFDASINGTRASLWLVNAVVILSCCAAIVLGHFFFNKPENKEIISKVHKKKDKYHDAVQKTEGVFDVLNKTREYSVMLFTNMLITLFCFPLVGPYRWEASQLNKDFFVGVYQVGDLIGRYAPNISDYLLVRRVGLWVIVILRLLLCLSFYLTYRLRSQTFWQNFVLQLVQMIVLSLSNGWTITCLLVQMPSVLDSDLGRARVGAVGLLFILLGITAGQWIATAATTFA